MVTFLWNWPSNSVGSILLLRWRNGHSFGKVSSTWLLSRSLFEMWSKTQTKKTTIEHVHFWNVSDLSVLCHFRHNFACHPPLFRCLRYHQYKGHQAMVSRHGYDRLFDCFPTNLLDTQSVVITWRLVFCWFVTNKFLFCQRPFVVEFIYKCLTELYLLLVNEHNWNEPLEQCSILQFSSFCLLNLGCFPTLTGISPLRRSAWAEKFRGNKVDHQFQSEQNDGNIFQYISDMSIMYYVYICTIYIYILYIYIYIYGI